MSKFMMAALLAIAVATLSSSAIACGCDVECRPGETYSDDAEMCVPDKVS